MPVVVPVAGDVGPVTVNAVTQSGTGGTTISPGQWLYLSSGQLQLATASSGASEAECVGMAITPSTSGKGIVYVNTAGTVVDVGTTLTEDTWYSISSTAGAIEPVSDSSSGDYRTWVGFGNADGNLELHIIVTGTQKS